MRLTHPILVTALLVGVIATPIAGVYVTRDLQHRASRILCTTSGLGLRPYESRAITAVLHAQLPRIGSSSDKVRPLGNRCFDTPGTSGEAKFTGGDLLAPVDLVMADSGKRQLRSGTRVLLRCTPSQSFCGPDQVSRVSAAHRPLFPVLRAILPGTMLDPSHIHFLTIIQNDPELNYGFLPTAARFWCQYSRTRVGQYSALVLNGMVMLDAKITAPMCNADTRVSGLLHIPHSRLFAPLLVAGALSGRHGLLVETQRALAPTPFYLDTLIQSRCDENYTPLAFQRCYSPRQFAYLYGLQTLHQRNLLGQGTHIAIVAGLPGLTGPSLAFTAIGDSVRAFDAYFGLPIAPLMIYRPGGGRLVGFAAFEELIQDVEMAHAIAPRASLEVILVPPSPALKRTHTGRTALSDKFVGSLTRTISFAVQRLHPDVISLSYGAPEDCVSPHTLQAFHRVMVQARVQHVTVVAATGDTGAAVPSCRPGKQWQRGVNFPASDPLVLGVGGTTVAPIKGSLHLHDVAAWSSAISPSLRQPDVRDVTRVGTGGGFSRIFARPGYQAQAIPGGGRGVPDVAFAADARTAPALAFAARNTYGIEPGGGTSLGAPAWAGFIALMDQAVGHRLGFVNPWLYSVAASDVYPSAFHDIRAGNNANNVAILAGTSYAIAGYSARRGWDPLTGLGTPNVGVLVQRATRLHR